MHNQNTTDNQAEVYDVVNEQDEVVGQATRKEVHSDPRLIHRAAGGYIFNRKKEILMQKRSKTKDMFPSHWAFSVGGHVDSGDSYENAAKRELQEELGIQIPLHFIEKRFVRHASETEFWSIYLGVNDGPFPNFNVVEIDEVKFFSLERLQEASKRSDELFVPEVTKLLPDIVKLIEDGILEQKYPELEWIYE